MSANNTQPWDKERGIITSRNGGWFAGKGVYCHGYNMMEELVGEVSYFQLMILNAIGRLVERPVADWFEARQICLSWPDPRIWCNQVGALAGTMRTSVTAATTAGVLAADSRSYGGSQTAVEGIRFIQGALVKLQQGMNVEEMVKQECARHGGKPHIMGYARPIAKGDERIAAMEKVSRQLGFTVGEHLQLAYQIEEILQRDFDEGMNINGYASAFMADQGISGNEAYRISATLVASGVTACYVDAIGQPAESFYPLQCNDIDYQGQPPRPFPRK